MTIKDILKAIRPNPMSFWQLFWRIARDKATTLDKEPWGWPARVRYLLVWLHVRAIYRLSMESKRAAGITYDAKENEACIVASTVLMRVSQMLGIPGPGFVATLNWSMHIATGFNAAALPRELAIAMAAALQKEWKYLERDGWAPPKRRRRTKLPDAGRN